MHRIDRTLRDVDRKRGGLMKTSAIRVFCVDDHPMIIEGLVSAINRQADMEVVGSAGSVGEAIAAYDRERPDIMLMDLRLSNSNGVEAIRAIRAKHPSARIIVLTVCQGDEDVFRAMVLRAPPAPPVRREAPAAK